MNPFKKTACLGVFLAFLAGPCAAQAGEGDKSAPAPAEVRLSEVVVSAKQLSDSEERRYATAAKQVFGREELDRHGDSSLVEVLKRLPGITLSGTPGRGGEIRMRGLGKGYTLILINGEAAPRGLSLDSLTPEQVERIEVMRAPVAEHSARAIAGTVNIVLREEFAKRENEARPSLGWEEGRFQPGLSLQRNDRIGTLSYLLAANLYHRDLPNQSTTTTTASDTRSGAPLLLQTQQENSRSISDGLHLNARLNWRLEGGNSFSFQPFLTQWRGTTEGATRLDQPLGSAPFAAADWRTESDYTMARGMGQLQLKLNGGAKLDIRFSGNLNDNDSQTVRYETDAQGSRIHTIRNVSDTRDAGFSTSGKYAAPLGQAQQLATGWELESGKRRENAGSFQDGVNPLARYGDSVQVQTRRLAAYVQDEWDISPLWSAYGGLRWEGIRTLSEAQAYSAQNRSGVLSPLFHSVWRFSPESKDQLRLGLTRSYRAPTLTNLAPVPTLSANYPASGANTATSPDSVGNPELKPELAWGLDLAFEHYFKDGGLVGISLFRRNIDDLIRNVTSLQSVDWSAQPRWVSTPRNIGQATTQGIELEAKFRLDELLQDAPPLSLRANYSRYHSNVEDVPGPDNRLDQQPTQSANLGLDYRLRSLPLTVGGNFNWLPAFSVRQTEAQWYSQGVKRVFDVYALWKIDPNAQVRLSASNLLHGDYSTANREIFADTEQSAQTVRKTFSALSARLEMRF